MFKYNPFCYAMILNPKNSNSKFEKVSLRNYLALREFVSWVKSLVAIGLATYLMEHHQETRVSTILITADT